MLMKSIAENAGDTEAVARHERLAQEHGKLHERYKTDDNARDVAHRKAKEKYPAAAKASEPIVIYSLHRPGAPGLADAARPADSPALVEK